jgi:hypothetical protein
VDDRIEGDRLHKLSRWRGNIMELRGKKIAILGERDGVPAHTIEQAIENLGAEVVYATTQCFV